MISRGQAFCYEELEELLYSLKTIQGGPSEPYPLSRRLPEILAV